MKTQEQLDNAIRQAKGRCAVEEMVYEDDSRQIFLLSGGILIEVNKLSAKTTLVTAASKFIFKGEIV